MSRQCGALLVVRADADEWRRTEMNVVVMVQWFEWQCDQKLFTISDI